MPDRLSIHEPVLINTIGHCAGAVVFGILLYLFLVNWRRAGQGRSSLPAIAAALAMLWNVGSLIALAGGPAIVVAASFSVLSLLPAVLLHISLQAHHRALWVSGYVLSAVAVALHIGDLILGAPRFHYAAVLLVTLGFGLLTAVSVVLERAAGSRLAGAMGLFLYAISFAHFGANHPSQAWSGEVALHHAGLPLALLVLLQDYRFLLLDTFIRFVVNASLAAAAVLIAMRAIRSPEFLRRFEHPLDAGLLFVAACLLLTLFVFLRNGTQRLLTRVIFLRANLEEPLRELRHLGRAATDEAEYIQNAVETIARFLHTSQFELAGESPQDSSWAQAIVPLRLSRGDTRTLLLGPRKGGRRYLSEDYKVLSRLVSAVVEHVEQVRELRMHNLVSQAELRALQAQINPHFLFNSLNTLYGTISRDNSEARRLVLNLADVFRYLLHSDRPFIQVEEELKIVRAYLAIEELRLGPKLRTEFEIEDDALRVTIPVLSIQPLVENAVKHGVAAQAGNGFVRIMIAKEAHAIRVAISNSGEFAARDTIDSGPGIGLTNVRRRLALHYGQDTRVEVRVVDGVTTVGFTAPLSVHHHSRAADPEIEPAHR